MDGAAIENQALQQIGPPQHRGIGGRRPAKDDMIAAAGTGMASIGHEFVGAKPDLTGILVKALVVSTSAANFQKDAHSPQ